MSKKLNGRKSSDKANKSKIEQPVFFLEEKQLCADECFRCGESCKTPVCVYYIHGGKFVDNNGAREWSCCQSNNISAKGCERLEDIH